MDPTILCCGEGLIDFIPTGSGRGTLDFRAFPGGSPFNVARALGRLGVPTGFLTALSSDFFGDLLLEGLEESRVDTSFVARLPLPATLGFVKLKDAVAQYAFYDASAADREWTGAATARLTGATKALHFGSISLIREPAANSFETLFAREAGGARLVSLDPNIRADMVRDVEAYRARMERMMAGADIVKVSAEDLEWLAPEAAFDDMAARVLAGRAVLFAVTKGGEGATLWTRGDRVSRPAPPTDVLDTVGAGDSFMAGLLTWLHEQQRLDAGAAARLAQSDLEALLGFAQQVASLTCSRQGADAPWRDQLRDASA